MIWNSFKTDTDHILQTWILTTREMMNITYLADYAYRNASPQSLFLNKRISMKNFTMQFTHPIKGVIRLFKQGDNCASHVMKVDTVDSELLEIPLTGIARGNWDLVLNWEYEEKGYTYRQNLQIF